MSPGAHQEAFFSTTFLSNYWNFIIPHPPRSLRASYKDVIWWEWPFDRLFSAVNPFGIEYYFIIHLQRCPLSILVFQIAVQLLPSWVSTWQEMHLNALKLSVKMQRTFFFKRKKWTTSGNKLYFYIIILQATWEWNKTLHLELVI